MKKRVMKNEDNEEYRIEDNKENAENSTLKTCKKSVAKSISKSQNLKDKNNIHFDNFDQEGFIDKKDIENQKEKERNSSSFNSEDEQNAQN